MPTDNHHPSPWTQQHRAFTKAFTAAAQRLVAQARAEADPPNATQLFRSHSFENTVLAAMGTVWEQEASAIRCLDPAWRAVADALRSNVRTLEQEYHAWFETGGGYDEEHIPPAPALDHPPQPITWTNPITGRETAATQIGQIILLSSRWVTYRVPRPRYEKHVTWYEASSGFLFHTATLSATLPAEKEQQEARAVRFAEAISALCHWDAYYTASHRVQRSVRKRFLVLRETFEQS